MKKMRNAKLYATLLVIVMLAGLLSLSPSVFSLMGSVIIRSTGQISLLNVTAESGYWRDIQAAIDLVAAHGGVGNVYIPEGTFNFVNVGEAWDGVRVVIPAGVNLFGAPTERTRGLPYDGVGQNPNDQVVGWRTVLRLPWDVPGSWDGGEGDPPLHGGPRTPFWFKIEGTSDPSKPSRFSDLKLVGYRSIDPNSKFVLKGVEIENVVDFRIDHSYFEHVAGGAIANYGIISRGIIDHSFFVNPVGFVEASYYNNTVGYGAGTGRAMGDYWEDDISKVLGKYTDYTLFIEDSYFEKWRHGVASNSGGHYVFRHSTIKNDFGMGSLDAHGWGRMENGVVVQVGTRAVEIYNSQIIDSTAGGNSATYMRGGAGVAFNNIVGGGGYGRFIYFSDEAQPEVSKCWINDWWIWNNTILPGVTEVVKYDPEGRIIEGVNYFRYAPHTFNYEPYPYPHPLTLETEP